MVLKKGTRNQVPLSQCLSLHSSYLSLTYIFSLLSIHSTSAVGRPLDSVWRNGSYWLFLTTIFSLLLCLHNPVLFHFPLFMKGKPKPNSMLHTNQSCLLHSFATVISLGPSRWHIFSQWVEGQVSWITSEKISSHLQR